MITFARGLVLRRGDRAMEFERDLGNGQVQFKFQDTYEVRTFPLNKIYKDILSEEVQIVHSTSALGLPNAGRSEAEVLVLPDQLSPAQHRLIAFRMHYVRAAVAARVMAGSARQCAALIHKTARPVPLDVSIDRFDNLKTPKPATLMRWLRVYHASGGNPFALCDRRPLGIRPKRLSRRLEQLVEESIVKHYLQLRGKSVKQTYRELERVVDVINRCEGLVLEMPSERTVNRRVLEIPPYTRDCKRMGIAYARNKWRFSLKGDQSTRILERAEVDHTLLDIWVLDPRSGVPLGRPWITVVMDRMSGYPLGVYISFYGPSSATVSSALKAAILPKDDLMNCIPEVDRRWTAMGCAEMYVVDNGLEFHAAVFRRIAWELRTDVIYNPVRQPWLKSSVERVMLEFNRSLPSGGRVHAPIKNAEAPDPRRSAVILFDDLCAGLLTWAAERFPLGIHPKTLVRPIDLWDEGRESGPPFAMPTSLRQLELATGVSTHRTIGGDGVFFKYLRYNSYELQNYLRAHGQFRAQILFNPDDLGRVHVLLPKPKTWLSVELQRPSIEYGAGLSLLQHEIIRKEAGKRLSQLNAEEELRKARWRIEDMWGEAKRVGIKARKHASLVRMQGLTSARLTGSGREAKDECNGEPATSPPTGSESNRTGHSAEDDSVQLLFARGGLLMSGDQYVGSRSPKALAAAQQVVNVVVEHLAFQRIRERCLDLVATMRVVKMPEGVLIHADSGMGKTLLLQMIKRQFTTSDSMEAESRCLHISLDSAVDTHQIAAAVMLALGYPMLPSRPKLESMNHLVAKGFERLKPQALLIDEMQHICEGNKDITARAVTDWLKVRMDAFNVPVIGAGTRTLERLSMINPQFTGRASANFVIAPFQFGEAWLQLLGAFAAAVSEVNLEIINGPIARPLHVATAGNLRALKRLLKYSAMRAAERSDRRVSVEDLARGFDEANGHVAGRSHPFRLNEKEGSRS